MCTKKGGKKYKIITFKFETSLFKKYDFELKISCQNSRMTLVEQKGWTREVDSLFPSSLTHPVIL